MKLSKAKELIENGTHYLCVDTNNAKMYNELSKIYLTNRNPNRKPIYLSEITDDEDIVYQWKTESGNWIDIQSEIRIKPKPDFSNELEALNKKANENNMKVIVTFEKKL